MTMSTDWIYTASSDTELAAAVLQALRHHADVRDDRIAVTVTDGWVTLSGRATHVVQWAMADCTARYVPGVKGVTNAIEVPEPEHPAPRRPPTRLPRERYSRGDVHGAHRS
jgi:osmotically-inducible protein OsmY